MPCDRFPDAEAEARKAMIETNGQPVCITVEIWDERLLVLALAPLDGFVHLVANVDECIAEVGKYHISVCQQELVSDDVLQNLKQELNGLETVLPILKVRSEGCMELGDCTATELISDLHEQEGAWYRGWPLHISG